jgi:hypothetical protein
MSVKKFEWVSSEFVKHVWSDEPFLVWVWKNVSEWELSYWHKYEQLYESQIQCEKVWVSVKWVSDTSLSTCMSLRVCGKKCEWVLNELVTQVWALVW